MHRLIAHLVHRALVALAVSLMLVLTVCFPGPLDVECSPDKKCPVSTDPCVIAVQCVKLECVERRSDATTCSVADVVDDAETEVSSEIDVSSETVPDDVDASDVETDDTADAQPCPEGCDSLDGPCTVGACQNGGCVALAANDLASCEDGDRCTANDRCMAGVCIGRQRHDADDWLMTTDGMHAPEDGYASRVALARRENGWVAIVDAHNDVLVPTTEGEPTLVVGSTSPTQPFGSLLHASYTNAGALIGAPRLFAGDAPVLIEVAELPGDGMGLLVAPGAETNLSEGGPPLTRANQGRAYVRIDAAGAPLNAIGPDVGNLAKTWPWAVAPASGGAVIAAGNLTDALRLFGPSPFQRDPDASDGSILVARISGAGQIAWSWRGGGPTSHPKHQKVLAVAAGETGTSITVGAFESVLLANTTGPTLSIGGQGGLDGFALELDAEGQPTEAWGVGTPGDDHIDRVVMTPDGRMLLVAEVTGQDVVIRNSDGVLGTLSAPTDAIAGYDTLVLALGAAGELAWSIRIDGGEAEPSLYERSGQAYTSLKRPLIAAHREGFVVAGTFNGPELRVIGGTTHTLTNGFGDRPDSTELYLVGVDTDGQITFARTLGGGDCADNACQLRLMAAGSLDDDSLLLAGTLQGTMTLGGLSKSTASSRHPAYEDVWMMRVDSDGELSCGP